MVDKKKLKHKIFCKVHTYYTNTYHETCRAYQDAPIMTQETCWLHSLASQDIGVWDCQKPANKHEF